MTIPDNHSHRVCVVAEAFHLLYQVFVDERMAHNLGLPIGLLAGTWEGAVDEEVGNFEEGRLLHKLFDVIATVLQNTFISIDHTYFRFAACRVCVARIQGASSKSESRGEILHDGILSIFVKFFEVGG